MSSFINKTVPAQFRTSFSVAVSFETAIKITASLNRLSYCYPKLSQPEIDTRVKTNLHPAALKLIAGLKNKSLLTHTIFSLEF